MIVAWNYIKTAGAYILKSLKAGEIITVSMDDSGITDI